MADEAHERIHIDAPVDVCFDLATDFEGYPAWTSDVKHATVRRARRRRTFGARRLPGRRAGPQRAVRPRLRPERRARSFSWQLVEGDMLRALEGRYTFDDVDGGTDVTYDLSVDLAMPLPGLVKRRAAGRIVGAALQDLKHAAEARVAVPRHAAGPARRPSPSSSSTPSPTSGRARGRPPPERRAEPPTSRRGRGAAGDALRRRGHRRAVTPAAVGDRGRASPSCSVRCPRSATTCSRPPTSCSTPPRRCSTPPIGSCASSARGARDAGNPRDRPRRHQPACRSGRRHRRARRRPAGTDAADARGHRRRDRRRCRRARARSTTSRRASASARPG